MAVSISVRDAHKDFSGYAALRGVTFAAKKGELVALLGPSGSGKTTLLRAIAGLENLDAGSVYFDAMEVSSLPLRERGIGFVFQSYALFRHMTVFENIAFGLRARPRRQRPPENDIRRRVDELLDLVQLPDLGQRFPSQLSGGQRQRVALARALAIEPRVLLLDEPFGALDAKVRRDLRAWLRALHERIGLTTIFVTHDQEEALELADRVAILNDGRIEQIDTPDGIYDSPSTEFVCRFLGDASRIPVRVVHGEARVGNTPVLGTTRAGDSLYVRPPDVRIVEDGGALQGIVAGLRRVGGVRRLDIVLPGAEGAQIEIDHLGDAPAKGAQVGLRIERGWVF